ncbi:unnamed protein product [Lathyrus sativus]|nr:unnamed protein product [Lathyrus sativus]
MDSKRAILILGLLAMVLISSEVSARELTEEVAEKSNELNDAKFLGFHRHHRSHRHDHRHRHGHRGGHGVDIDNGN